MLDVDQALEALRAVVADAGPSHIYDGPMIGGACVYADSAGNACCIAGRVLEHVAPDTWRDLETVVGNLPAPDLFTVDGLVTWEASRVLSRAQWEQDNGKTWGEALAAAVLLPTELRAAGKC